ncbi:hypothetical protein ACX1DW_04790 [Stutzerimonas sp. KH-1]|jgi:hypothetical protein
MRDCQKKWIWSETLLNRFGPSNPQEIKKFISYCKKAPERNVFFALFSFFYDPSLQENKFQRQQVAGTLLFELAPASALELEGSIYAAAKFWDYSIEELPWYWCKAFGTNIVVNFPSDVLPGIEDKETIKSIQTMLFWCRGFEQQCT